MGINIKVLKCGSDTTAEVLLKSHYMTLGDVLSQRLYSSFRIVVGMDCRGWIVLGCCWVGEIDGGLGLEFPGKT